MLLKILKKDMFRKKVMNFILFLFILLATLFVATGISNVVTVLNGTNYYFDRAGIGDYLVLVQGEDAVRELDHYLKTQASIKSFRYENGFSTNREHVFVNGKEADDDNMELVNTVTDRGLTYFDADNNRVLPIQKGHIRVSGKFAHKNDLKEGDKIEFRYEDVKLTFIYDGILKDAALGSEWMGNTRFLLSQEDFDTLLTSKEISGLYHMGMGYIVTDDVQAIASSITEISGISFNGGRNVIQMTYLLNVIIALIILVLSVALIIVSFVVLRFAINLSVMEDFHEIGVMKAIGIRNSKIRGMYAIKYIFIAVIGAVGGCILSFPFGELLIRSVSENMVLGNKNDFLLHIIGSLAVVLIIFLFAYGCTRKVKKLSPIDAIRNGQTGERFKKKKGRSLKKSKGSTELFLALNDIKSTPKRYLSVILSIAICTVLVLIIVNTTVTMRSDAFEPTLGTRNDLYVSTKESETNAYEYNLEGIKKYLSDKEKLLSDHGMPARLSAERGYKYNLTYHGKTYKTTFVQGINCETDAYTYVEGSAPQSKNEIAISLVVADMTGLKIGDNCEVEAAGETLDCIVTGTFQTMNNLGESVLIHKDVPTSFDDTAYASYTMINFKDDPSDREIEERKEKIREFWDVEKIYNSVEYVDATMNSADTMETVQNMLLLITLIVVILVTVLMERSFVQDEKTQIALLKAIGFKDRAVVKWHMLRFTVCCVIAVLIAILLSVPMTHIAINPIFRLMGLKKVDYRYGIYQLGLYPGIIVAFTTFMAWITAQASKRIKSNDTANNE